MLVSPDAPSPSHRGGPSSLSRSASSEVLSLDLSPTANSSLSAADLSARIAFLKDRLRKARQDGREAKAIATESLALNTKIQERGQAARATLHRRIDRLQAELAEQRETQARLDERHHAALRLIGELWTRNLNLVDAGAVDQSG
jgi:vacuolar-type H+-ATPase subunit I/STV1